jgi:hypothetical protein
MTPEYRIIDDNVYVPEHYHVHNSATKGYVKGSIKHLSGIISRRLRALSGDIGTDIAALSGLLDLQYLALSGNVETDITAAITSLISGAPGALDTLKEISDYISGEGGLSGLITALEMNTDEALQTLSGKIANEHQLFSGVVEGYVAAAIDTYTAFSGAIDSQKVDKNLVGDQKIVQDITFDISKGGLVSWVKNLVSLHDGEIEQFKGKLDLVTEHELKEIVTILSNKINEKINIANFGEGSIVKDIRIDKIDQYGNIHVAAQVFNAKKGTAPVTWVQEIVLQDGLEAKLSGDKLVLGNLVQAALEDYIAENDVRVAKKVNSSQFGNGLVVQDVELRAGFDNTLRLNQEVVNVITGHGDKYEKNREIELRDGLTSKSVKGKLIIGSEVSGALVEHIQTFNDTISNLVGTAPETLDQLHEIAAYISGEEGLSGFITNNLIKIDAVSGIVAEIAPKAVNIAPQPDADKLPAFAKDTANKRVLLQSITFDEFSKDNKEVVGWEVDLDTGDEIPIKIDVSKLVDEIAAINQAIVDPRPELDLLPDNTPSPAAGRRVLLQSITMEKFNTNNFVLTGHMADLDTGKTFPIDIDVRELVSIVAQIDRAKVEHQNVPLLPDGSKNPTDGMRVLMQSISFKDLFTQQILTVYMANLDNGKVVPVEIDVSSILTKLAENRAVVNKQTAEYFANGAVNPTYGKRVLLQSIDFNDFSVENQKVVGWEIDLDDGTEIPVEIDVSKVVADIAGIDRAVVEKNPEKKPYTTQKTNGKRVLLKSINLDEMVFQDSNDQIKNIFMTVVDLDTGEEIEYQEQLQSGPRNAFKKWFDKVNSWALYKDRAIVNEVDVDGKKVRPLMQSITFDEIEDGKLNAWSIDLNTGDEIKHQVDLLPYNMIANVKPEPAGYKLPDGTDSKTTGKRVLMQSIDISKALSDKTITAYMADLNTGEIIPVTFGIDSLIDELAKDKDKAVVNATTDENPAKGKRVLLQSITYDFEKTSGTLTVTGHMVNLDDGSIISFPYKFTLETILKGARDLMDLIATKQNDPPYNTIISDIKDRFKAWL